MVLIKTEVRNRVGILKLNDPKKRNAITLEMNEEIVAQIEKWEGGHDVKAVVITGVGKGFCAGADLDDLLAGESIEEMESIYAGFLRVAHSSLPIVGAVNGPAVGAGMNMLLACDVVIASREQAQFDSRFLQIAIHPGGGHTWRLRSIVGRQATMAMVLFGEVLSAQRAADIGLVWRVVDDSDLLKEAVAMAERAASQGKDLNARTKATILTLDTVSGSDAAVDHELYQQLWSMKQPEFTELIGKLKQNISSKI